MIKSFEVSALQGKWDYSFTFHSDLNILTGKNGSGKTTLLKLLWYCLSGNVARIRAEMTLQHARLETTSFKLTLAKEQETEMVFELEIGGQKIPLAQEVDLAKSLVAPYLLPQSDPADEVKSQISSLDDSSVFFPTFRRIEGGFTMEQNRRRPG